MRLEPASGAACRRDHWAVSLPSPAITGLDVRAVGSPRELHLAVEQNQKTMAIVATAGQRGDLPQFESVLAMARVPRVRPGRPRVRPDRVRADKTYTSRKNRTYLHRRRIRCTIPDKADQARSRQKLRSRGRLSTRPNTASAMRSSAGSTAS
ncbi:transposase [Streptomyces sp. NPDC056056]|uniref:transposase n=1 Tax=Streptomyces sp. NPDC056056 TaxID=3345698 RepID=UPI0035E353CC